MSLILPHDIPWDPKEKVEQPEGKLLLIDGRTIDGYPRKGDNPMPANGKLFTDNAFFLLANYEKILSDSRMFLAPIGVVSGLAYVGTSSFARPTLGIYIEWRLMCNAAILFLKGTQPNLLWHLAGSPLSGCNKCSCVDVNGERHTIEVCDFCKAWRIFTCINGRYKQVKDLYEAYSLDVVNAQYPMTPATNINHNGYPRINEDLSVEFQVKAPDAALVQIDLCGKKYDLMKGDDGTWTGVTDPQVPGFHYYFLVIDGVSVADPASESFYGCGRMSSGIEVPEDGCELFESADVAHGQVRSLNYFSELTGGCRPIFVYTPPSYESGQREYPVIYIHHGGGEDHRGWVQQGRIANIMDNLIAEGRATECIVVSVNSNVPGAGGYSPDGMKAYATELTENILPFVESTFRVAKGAENRTMCGLSMGGGQSFYIGLLRPDLFSNIGIFSSGIFGGIVGAQLDLEKEVPGMLSNTEAFNNGLDVFYISCGEQDPRISHTKKYVDFMREAGVEVVFNSFPGDHEWQVWRKSFADFVPLLYQNYIQR